MKWLNTLLSLLFPAPPTTHTVFKDAMKKR